MTAIAFAALALAPAAMAADGVGTGGRTTDKSVTFFCFAVIALFMLLPIVLSLIQAKLEGRKDRRTTESVSRAAAAVARACSV